MRIVVSVTNDLASDQRVHKVCSYLSAKGHRVLLVGRLLPESNALEARPYFTKRFRLWARKGAIFYANYNIRLFFFLLFHKVDLLVSNDLDSLPANYFAKLFKPRTTLVYDTHELFTEVPELQGRRFQKGTWSFFEKLIFPRLRYVYTVNRSIADFYSKKYGVPVGVVRNVSPLLEVQSRTRKELGLPEGMRILILQGAGINIHRGGEEAVEAMAHLTPDYHLVIAGKGDAIPEMKCIAKKKGLEDRVHFRDRMPYLELRQLTEACDLGLSLDKDTNMNYAYSLPNKVFDYLHSGVPVLASARKEIMNLNNEVEVIEVVDQVTPEAIADSVKALFDSERYQELKARTRLAAERWNWQAEEKNLDEIYTPILQRDE